MDSTNSNIGWVYYDISWVFYHELIEKHAVYTITAYFTAIFFALSIQDIAVDGWAITIVKPRNLPYASSSQSLGMSIGVFISKTGFFAFNSLTF